MASDIEPTLFANTRLRTTSIMAYGAAAPNGSEDASCVAAEVGTLSASADRHLPRQRVATSQSPIDRPERENTAPEYTSGITETPIMHPGPCRLHGAVYVQLPP